MNIFIDIETVPSQHPDALTAIRSTLRPPGTLKKPESIAAWWANEAEAAAVEAWRKQSLDGGTAGEVASIALCGEDGPGWVCCRAPGESESALLESFGLVVQTMIEQAACTGPDGRAWPVGEPFFIAHNAPFDLGYLWRRCAVHDVRLPFALPGPMARAGKDYADTMLMWAGYGGRVSMDALCRALGVDSPKDGGMDGSQVFDRWLAGDVSAIERYNLADALAVREVWNRLHVGTAQPVKAAAPIMEDLPL
jgi:hypothetical protein